jgi:predicted O-linked N-acetylglucosamine transferase (SPINDLY family)
MSRSGSSLAQAFERGTRHHQAGELQQAAVMYRQVLSIDPRHADSRHLLGVIALQIGQAATALSYFDDALKLQPRLAEYHNSRGKALRELGRLAEAEAAWRQALRLRGRFPEARFHLGALLLNLGRFADAASCGREAVRQTPDAWEAQTLLGHALAGLGQPEEAEPYYQKAVRLNPRSPDAHNNLGYVLNQLGRATEAEACYREALRLDPGFASAHNNLGCCLQDLRRLADAELCFREALRLKPDFADALANLAGALEKLGRCEEAEACCRAALRLKPDLPDAHNTLGSIFRSTARPAEAEASYREALRLRPGFALAHSNLGCIMLDFGRTIDAVACFREALRSSPGTIEARTNLILALKKLGHWRQAEAEAREVLRRRPDFSEARVNLGHLLLAQERHDEAISQFEQALAHDARFMPAWQGLRGAWTYVPDADPDRSFAANRAFGRTAASQAKPKSLTNSRVPDRRLRIGWLSSDFRAHPVGRNLELFFAHRNAVAFETICYADVKTPDTMTDWFRGHCDLWRSISGLDDAAVADLIRTDGIDIMIYLAGRFDSNHPELAAWRPAPVQISLFDAGTSGLAEMDYLIADPVMVPAHPVEQFTERVLRLPNFYLHSPPNDSPLPNDPPSLSGRGVTFGCFHNPTKLNSDVVALWSEILRRLPHARLRFKYLELYASDELRAAMRKRFGEELKDRIEFDPIRTAIGQHLSQYDQIDIALDPFPFNGSTATFEALCMGVPVVTLLGRTLMGRWTASMLNKVDLTECIARSPDDYVEIATRLAAEQGRLVELRHELRARVRGSALCDGARTTRYLERALRGVWRKWCRDGNPAPAPEAQR